MLTCRQVAESVTDYLDNAMGFGLRLGVRLHLMMCKNCRQHVEKMRQMLDALEHLPPDKEAPEEWLESVSKKG